MFCDSSSSFVAITGKSTHPEENEIAQEENQKSTANSKPRLKGKITLTYKETLPTLGLKNPRSNGLFDIQPYHIFIFISIPL